MKWVDFTADCRSYHIPPQLAEFMSWVSWSFFVRSMILPQGSKVRDYNLPSPGFPGWNSGHPLPGYTLKILDQYSNYTRTRRRVFGGTGILASTQGFCKRGTTPLSYEYAGKHTGIICLTIFIYIYQVYTSNEKCTRYRSTRLGLWTDVNTCVLLFSKY